MVVFSLQINFSQLLMFDSCPFILLTMHFKVALKHRLVMWYAVKDIMHCCSTFPEFFKFNVGKLSNTLINCNYYNYKS